LALTGTLWKSFDAIFDTQGQPDELLRHAGGMPLDNPTLLILHENMYFGGVEFPMNYRAWPKEESARALNLAEHHCTAASWMSIQPGIH